MWDIYLPIFPSSNLSHSVITTVWVGIFVISFFNLRFGWIFSGLVVPGYLTPLLLIKPISVAVIVFESILTYQLVYLLSEVAGRRGLWTNFFGRDRFFALLLGSVFIRSIFDGWILPWLNVWSSDYYNFPLDYQDSLHSFGLIIVALIANQLWKPKLAQGLFQLVVTVGITYLIVRYVLIEYTNFSLSNIGYLYEDIASSILASPKSYIILLVTAFIASRMNLFYGWEYNGILIPSLLALQWYQPTKILTSLVEAYVIFALATLILKIPLFKHMSIEGARKVLLFFNIGFFYKILLSLFIVEVFPEYKVSDYFGFGYLLSTLIAIKIYDKISIPFFTRATVQTSVFSIIIATVIGYTFTMIPEYPIYYQKGTDKKIIQEERIKSEKHLVEFIEEKKITLYGQNSDTYVRPTPSQQNAFGHVLDLIESDFWTNRGDIVKLLTELKYEIKLLQNRYLVLTPNETGKGWGMYIIDLDAESKLSIEVPYPFEAVNMIESAVSLMWLSHAKAVAFSGVNRVFDKQLSAAQANNYYSFYHTFHKHYAKNSILQIRALTDTYEKKFSKMQPGDKSEALLFIKGYAPQDLSLSMLKDKLMNIKVSWRDSKEESIQKKSMSNGFAELYLTKIDRISLAASKIFFLQGNEINTVDSIDSIEGLLQSWLLEKKLEIAGKNSNGYIKPTMQEIMYMDHSILVPISNILEIWQEKPKDYARMKDQLQSVAIAAKAIGYQLTWYYDKAKHKRYIVLHERMQNKRYWGTYVFGLNASENIMIQVPRPFYESYTFEYGIELFDRLDAKMLLLSAANPLANRDHSADIMLTQNKSNIFNLVSQVIFRDSGYESMNALQIRGKSQLSDRYDETAILAFNNGTSSLSGLNSTQQNIYEYLKSYIPLRINDGSIQGAGYNARPFQSQYLAQSLNNTFNVLWLPKNIRQQYRQFSENDLAVQQFKSIGVDIIDEDKLTGSLYQTMAAATCSDDIERKLVNYLKYGDIVEIETLNQNKKIVLKLLIDRSRKAYVIIFSEDQKHVLYAAKLHTLPPYKVKNVPKGTSFADIMATFSLEQASIMKVSTCEK